MIAAGLQGVDFVVAQHRRTGAHHVDGQARHPDGHRVTGGLGAGSQPEVGCAQRKKQSM